MKVLESNDIAAYSVKQQIKSMQPSCDSSQMQLQLFVSNIYIYILDFDLLRMDFQQICQRILDSHESIIGVWVFQMQELASSTRSTFPKLKKDEQEKMFLQAQVMIAIATSNERFYGKTRYVMVSFDTFDAYMFPLGSEQIISVGCIKPYSPEQVVTTVNEIIKNT